MEAIQNNGATFPIVESVRERDIDLLILEELYANTGLEKLFLKVVGKPEFIFSKAYRSVTTAGLGETDIQAEFVFNQKKLFLLIENKVDAMFQDAQYDRYMKRAELLAGPNIETAVILVAPKAYIDNKSEFEYSVSYEEILTWFSKDASLRSWYKSEILRLAIEQERRGYQAIKDEVVTEFWKKYYLYISGTLQELNMPQPKVKPTASSFVYFSPFWLLKNTRLIHKMEKGYVDLELSGMASQYEELLQDYNKLPPNMELVMTGKTVSFRLEVEPVSFEKEFEEQEYILKQVVDNCLIFKDFVMTELKKSLLV